MENPAALPPRKCASSLIRPVTHRTLLAEIPAEIVHQHHERLNGKGYPLKIKGDAICLEARILAVADVVEAMSSHRPYREALGIEKALGEINSHKGALYDPKVVDICTELFRVKGYKFRTTDYFSDPPQTVAGVIGFPQPF